MVPPDLIVGAAVRGSQVDVLVAAVGLDAKGNPDKAARALTGTSGRLARHFHFNHAVTERRVLDQRIRRRVGGVSVRDHLDCTPALIVGRLDRDVLSSEAIGRLRRQRNRQQRKQKRPRRSEQKSEARDHVRVSEDRQNVMSCRRADHSIHRRL